LKVESKLERTTFKISASAPGVKSEELREDGRWEIEDGNKKSWITAVERGPSGIFYR
jgi:hypothetical protein